MAQVTKTGFLVKNCYRKSIQIADSLDIMKANVHPVQIIQRLSRRKMVREKMRVTSGTFIPVLPPSLPASCNHGDTTSAFDEFHARHWKISLSAPPCIES